MKKFKYISFTQVHHFYSHFKVLLNRDFYVMRPKDEFLENIILI